MPSQRALSRRTFLQASAATAATAAFSAPAAGAQGANERLNIGLIGTGGRCRHLMQALVRVPNVRVTALCDVYEPHIEATRDQLTRAPLSQPAPTFTSGDFRRLLDRNDIHAVLIATPDHWHVPITVAACAAGKDVYVEKPLTHDLSEGRAVIEAQNRHRRIVQVGTQQRSMPHIIRARELIRAGRLGDVHKVHLTWNRNSDRVRRGPQNVEERRLDWRAFVGSARQQPFDAYRFRNWRWFWDFGNGLLGDLMVHWIDVVHWVFDLDHPQRATTIGDHYTSQDVWETPDTVQTLLTYNVQDRPNDLQVYFEGTFCNARNGAMAEFMGTNATLYLDRGRFEIDPERGRGRTEEVVVGAGRRGLDFYDRPDGELLHLTNWIDSIRSRRPPNTPAEAGVSAASAAHLGNQALRAGQVARWQRA
jgi:predicted dehydrogenase